MTIDRCLLTVEPKVFEPLARKYRPSEASNIKTLIQKITIIFRIIIQKITIIFWITIKNG